MTGRDSLTANKLFLAGGIAGVVECLAVQPLDMTKTRMQLMARGTVQPTVSKVLVDLVKEGGVLRMYRGILPELVAMTPKSSAMYSAYEGALRLLRPSKAGDDSAIVHGLAGFIAGTPEALVVTPFQVVKVRLQSKEHLHRYSSTAQCVRSIVVEEGVLALATGLHVTIWRNSIWNGVYFGLLHAMRGDASVESSGLVQSVRTLTMGFIAGFVATIFNNPFDVIKSRMQAELTSSQAKAGAPARGVNFDEAGFARLRTVVASEGVRGLYVGFTAKAMRMGFGGAIGMCAYEGATNWLSG